MRVRSYRPPDGVRVDSLTLYTPASFGRVLRSVPAAFVCLCMAAFGAVTTWIAPHSARVWYDPSLIYLISSLSAFRGREIERRDHPGTPVEAFGTLLLGLTYPVVHAARDGFVNHYLTHPQHFLSVAQTLGVGASIIVALLLA